MHTVPINISLSSLTFTLILKSLFRLRIQINDFIAISPGREIYTTLVQFTRLMKVASEREIKAFLQNTKKTHGVMTSTSRIMFPRNFGNNLPDDMTFQSLEKGENTSLRIFHNFLIRRRQHCLTMCVRLNLLGATTRLYGSILLPVKLYSRS
jgi:hypothetical protein